MFLMTTGYCGTSYLSKVTHQPEFCIIGFTLTLVWVSNAIPRPPAKRSVAIGLVNGFGNLGNL